MDTYLCRCVQSTSVCIISIIALLVLWTPVVSAQCGVQNACFPWSQKSCTRGGSMNLRFMLDISPERAWGNEKNRYVTYGFCPTVDKLSSFTLNQSIFYTSSYEYKEKVDDVEETKNAMSKGIYMNYLSVFGFGNTNNTEFPQKGISLGATVAAANATLTSCGGKGIWAASHLMLNVGLRRGMFNYVGSSPTGVQEIMNPNYNLDRCLSNAVPPDGVSYCNHSVTVTIPDDTRQPAYVGFEPTCKKNKCMFDEKAICFGDDSGIENCGYCYDTSGSTINQNTQVWVAYYGTDSTNAALISGGNSPLRYMKFATGSLAQKFKDKLSALWNGQYE